MSGCTATMTALMSGCCGRLVTHVARRLYSAAAEAAGKLGG